METEQFNDRLDILKHVSEIKLRLKKDITSDFVLAKLGDKDKEFIIEMTGNAYFSKRLVEMIREKGEKWSYINGIYKRTKLGNDEIAKLKLIEKSIFDSYMIKIYMTVILNRNVDKNYLINVLSGYVEKDEDVEETLKDERLKGAVSDLLADRDKKEEK